VLFEVDRTSAGEGALLDLDFSSAIALPNQKKQNDSRKDKGYLVAVVIETNDRSISVSLHRPRGYYIRIHHQVSASPTINDNFRYVVNGSRSFTTKPPAILVSNTGNNRLLQSC